MTALLKNKKYDVCMLGLGPVGAVSGVCFAKQGFKVIGVDIDPARVAALAKGKTPFTEPQMDGLVKQVVASGHFKATQDIKTAVKNSRIIMIAVGTPTPETGMPDLSQLDNVCAQIGESLKGAEKGAIIVVRSTVPPGTMRNRLSKIIAKHSGLKLGEGFHIASNPEFLREGAAIQDFFNTGRIVTGADNPKVAAKIEELYRDVNAGARLRVSLESAEFAKFVDNTWRALKVGFANELARVCLAYGGNIEETTQIFLSDTLFNISSHHLRPGFAFGGSCLPKDVRGLTAFARSMDVSIPIVEGILPSNRNHLDLGVRAVMNMRPKKVGILGVAFKEHVDDLRESPSLSLALALKQKKVTVVAHDPVFKAGTEIALKGSKETLKMMGLEALAKSVDTLVVIHRLPKYIELADRFAAMGGHVLYLTTPLSRPADLAAKTAPKLSPLKVQSIKPHRQRSGS